MRKAFDFSNWTRVPTIDDIATLRALGYTTAIIGASFDVALAREQISILVAAGFRIEVYGWLRHPGRAGLLDNAISACAGFPVERLWLDVEDADDALGQSPEQLAFDVRAALDYLHARATIPTGIYTGSWFWDSYMGTTDTFGEVLWLANYVSTPSVNFIYSHLPGGWKPDDLVIWQWNNHLAGTAFNADDNLILKETDMPDTYTRAEVDAKIGALLGLEIDLGQQIKNVGGSLWNHVANHNQTNVDASRADLQKMIDDLAAAQKALHDRIAAAGAILDG